MQRIDTKSGRDRLPPRREPYWHKIEAGRYVGYRKTLTGGYWQARFRDGAGKQHYRQLGQGAGDDFDTAKRAADAWIKTMTGGAGVKVRTGTVEAACESYAAGLEARGRPGTAADVRGRFDKFVNTTRKDDSAGDKLGAIRLHTLTRDDVVAWRDRINTADRSAATVNRNLRMLKAALTAAVRNGYAGNPVAWTTVETLHGGRGKRELFLDLKQRRSLIDKSPPALALFLTALLQSGARPGELARATIADFDKKQGTLTLRSAKGRGGEVRPRVVTLTPAGAALFKKSARRKLPAAPLLTGPEGGTWTKMQLSRSIRAAAKKAKLPPGVVGYSMRHAAISEWLAAGIDPVTAANRAGTSVLMIQQHYAKFIKAPAMERLESVQIV